MSSLNIVNIKAEKANAIRRNRKLRNITGLFRIIEVCVVLVLVSRFSTQLPIAFKNSGVYFRDLSMVLASPRFVFLVGNAIVITLFAKSAQFSSQDSSTESSGTDLYDKFIEKSEKNQQSRQLEIESQQKHSVTEDRLVLKDKIASCETKNYGRSQSENLNRACCEKSRLVLRRSETEKCKKITCSSQGSAKNQYPEDKMSNEEFRCKVDAFIARQQRFRREEAEYSFF